MLELSIFLFSAVANFLLGLVVYIKNPRAITNKLFLMLAITIVVWSGVNLASVHPVFFSQLVLIRLVLFAGAFLSLSVFLTFLAFPLAKLPPSSMRLVKLAIGATAIVMPLTLTPLVFKELRFVGASAQPVPNPGIVLFLAHTVILLGASLFILYRKYRHSTGVLRNQLRLILLGVGSTFALIIVNNLLLVVIFKVTILVPAGPLFTLLFTGALAYAIIKHRLFDIRTAVARSVAYLMTVAFMSIVYVGIVLGVTALLLDNAHTDTKTQFVYIAVAVLLASSFQRIKTIFDRISNKLFFRDAYDPQDFLNELNEVLVEKIQLEPLLSATLDIIGRNLKVSNALFVIHQTAYYPTRRVGSNPLLTPKTLEDITERTRELHHKVIVTDTIEDSHASLRNLLEKKDVAVTIKLVPTLEYNTLAMGYLFLGAKRSGEPYSNDDTRILEIISNELVIAIQNVFRFEEIEKFNITLQDKIDLATKQLKHTNDKLKELDETKDEFISMASHQLRTPLTSVKGYVSMVLEGDAGELNETQRKLLEQSFASSQRMVYLIADLLNLSRLRTGKFVIEAKPANLADVIESEVEQLKASAAGRNLTLTYDKPDNFPTLMIDETKIRQVIMNFADNAIYYTPSGGKIDIKLKETKDSVEFTVSDNGIGIPADEQHHLFNKFYRAKNAQKARPDGTGLGLFMAKKVIVAQGGAIIFKSKEGKGSTFGFMFSKAKLKVPETVQPELAKA